jgi:hypothetical protein
LSVRNSAGLKIFGLYGFFLAASAFANEIEGMRVTKIIANVA